MRTFPKSKYSFKQSLSLLFFYSKSNKLFMQTDSRAVWKKNTVGTPIRGLRRQCRVLLIQLLTTFSQLVSACFVSLANWWSNSTSLATTSQASDKIFCLASLNSLRTHESPSTVLKVRKAAAVRG